MNKNDENLNKILSGFYDSKQIEDFKNEIKITDEVFNSSSVPQPPQRLIDSIKNQIAEKSSHSNIHYLRYVAAAILLVIISLSAVMYINLSDSRNSYILTSEHWNSTNLEIDDQVFLEIKTALNDISNSLEDLEQNGYTQLSESIIELESDFAKYNDTLWKG